MMMMLFYNIINHLFKLFLIVLKNQYGETYG